jgi:hypothetical protein
MCTITASGIAEQAILGETLIWMTTGKRDCVTTVAYRPTAKRWTCKQQPLLGNASNIHSRNNRRAVLSEARVPTVSRQRLCKQAPAETNTHAIIEVLFETGFSVGPCRDVITVTIGAIKSVLYGNLKKRASDSWLQECSDENPAVERRYLECVIQWDCVKIRCQEMASGDCNRLWTLVRVCQWSVKCGHESWVYKWSTNRVTIRNPVYSHKLTRDNIKLYDDVEVGLI